MIKMLCGLIILRYFLKNLILNWTDLLFFLTALKWIYRVKSTNRHSLSISALQCICYAWFLITHGDLKYAFEKEMHLLEWFILDALSFFWSEKYWLVIWFCNSINTILPQNFKSFLYPIRLQLFQHL